MRSKKKFLILLNILLIVLVYFIITNIDTKWVQNQKNQKEEFPLIEETKKDYMGSVLKFSRSKYFTGNAFNIELNNGERFTIAGKNENSNYSKKKLESNLQIGDSIFYDHKTYEFYIFKDKETLKFKLYNSY